MEELFARQAPLRRARQRGDRMNIVVALLTIALAAPPNLTPPPGALNPQVTQANISQTICVPGWTKTVRPPVTYTDSLKRKQMTERHLPGKPADYEEDHW